MNIIITGTSRGIGLQLCKQLLSEGHHVLAVAKSPLKLTAPNLKILQVDLTNPEAPHRILESVKDWNTVDLLINNAGIFVDGESTEDFIKSFHVNSVVPFIVTNTLLGKLKKSNQPKVVHITSQMGSIADNTSGGHYAYRSSKAALNMINKSIVIDNPWLTSIVIHPGWVKTDMGGPSAPVTTEESVKGILQVAIKAQLKDSGAFLNYKGMALPW